MFENPSTLWLEILVLFLVGLFLVGMLCIHVYKKAKHIPTGDCCYCYKKKQKLLKDYHKVYGNNH